MVELTGISVEEFAHPEETAALKSLKKVKYAECLLDWIAKESTMLMLQTKVLGNYFRVMPQNMPGLYQAVEEVCHILDYVPMPQIYIFRSNKLSIEVFGGDEPLLVFPDFMVNDFDEGMLSFKIGCAVTALKAKTVQLKMASMAVEVFSGTVPFVREAVIPVLANWSRKAGLTECRGGLLACQDMGAAMRALMRIAGLPVQYIDTACLPEYIRNYQSSGSLPRMAQYLQTVFRMDAWNNDCIVELYKWYHSGQYDDILEGFE